MWDNLNNFLTWLEVHAQLRDVPAVVFEYSARIRSALQADQGDDSWS